MKPKVRKLVVIVGASAALGAAGCGGTSSVSRDPTRRSAAGTAKSHTPAARSSAEGAPQRAGDPSPSTKRGAAA